jgi:hypothetical protein
MALHLYTPEMGEKIDKKITTHARLAHYGKHYFVKSELGPDKIRGVGVVYMGKLTPNPDLLKMEISVRGDSPFVGYHEYKLTLKAFEKLQKTVDIGCEMLLD